MRLFHERMGHVNTKDCAALAAKQGIKLLETVDFTCDVCATAKQRKHPMPALAERQDVVPGEILHCDLKGPLEISYNKAVFVLVVVDEATRVVSTQAMKSKADVTRAFDAVFADFARHPILKKIRVGEHTTVHCRQRICAEVCSPGCVPFGTWRVAAAVAAQCARKKWHCRAGNTDNF